MGHSRAERAYQYGREKRTIAQGRFCIQPFAALGLLTIVIMPTSRSSAQWNDFEQVFLNSYA